MEDGKTILYEVLKDGVKNGEFKVLSLGIEQIHRTCEEWNLDITRHQIRRISDGEIMWVGLIDGTGCKVTID